MTGLRNLRLWLRLLFSEKLKTFTHFLKDMMLFWFYAKNVHKDKGSRRYRIWWFWKEDEGVIKDSINNNDLKELNDRLYKQTGYLFDCKNWAQSDKIFGKSGISIHIGVTCCSTGKNGQKKKVPVTVFSPYLQSMAHASEKEQFFNVFIIKEGLKQTAKEDCWRRSERNLCAFLFQNTSFALE